MPSVMTIEGPSCKYVIARGQYGKRTFRGCFGSKAEAQKAARRKGRAWSVVRSRPPGVPMSGLGASDGTHAATARRHAREAQRLWESFPGTCYGAIRVLPMISREIAQAKAHAWAMEERQPVSKLLGKLNRLERTVQNRTQMLAERCGGTVSYWR